MVSVANFNHTLTAKFEERIDYGDFSYAYGPILVPEDDRNVTVLGSMQLPMALDCPGLVIREFGKGAAGNGIAGARGPGDYAAVFTTAVPLPALLLRELARYSGSHIYGEKDDLIWADSSTLTIHSVTPGQRTFSLPRQTTVWDVINGQCLGDHLDRIELSVNPPQTAMFFLGDDPQIQNI